MPYIASNNGFSVDWHDPAEGYQPQAGEVDMGAEYPTSAQLAAAFPGYTAAVAKQQPQQSYAQALAAGCQIVSTSTLAISKTYPTDDQSLSNMADEVLSFTADSTFIGSATTEVWPVADGAVTLTVTQFTAVRKALSSRVKAWKQYAGGVAQQPPAQPVTIP